MMKVHIEMRPLVTIAVCTEYAGYAKRDHLHPLEELFIFLKNKMLKN